MRITWHFDEGRQVGGWSHVRIRGGRGQADGERRVTDTWPTPRALARPWWMTALAVACLASVAFLVPRDLFLAHTRDVEVWFGFELRGAAARVTAPVHWGIFLAGAWGFWFERPWIVPCAAAYAFYVALCHLVWNVVSPHGSGGVAGVAETVAFSVPGFLLVRAHRRAKRRSVS